MPTSSLRQITRPTIEPVSLAEAKDHLGILDSHSDDRISALIIAARSHVEQYINGALPTQTWELSLDEFPSDGSDIILPKPPCQDITYITYVDEDGDEQTWVDWDADLYSFPSRVRPEYGTSYPTTKGIMGAITIRFTCGYEPDDEYGSYIPEDIKLAMKLLIAHWNENREAVIVGTSVSELPMAVKSLLGPYKNWTFA